MPAQEIERRNQRQPEDGEIIAIHPLEQLTAKTFQLICADAGGRRFADGIKIKIDERVGECAHGQARGVDMLEQYRTVLHKSDRRVKLMTRAGQGTKLRLRRATIGRLGELV